MSDKSHHKTINGDMILRYPRDWCGTAVGSASGSKSYIDVSGKDYEVVIEEPQDVVVQRTPLGSQLNFEVTDGLNFVSSSDLTTPVCATMRKLPILIAAFTIFSCIYLYNQSISHRLFNFRGRSISIRYRVQKAWLERKNQFLPVIGENVEVIGRWTPNPDGIGLDAGFPGSRIRFSFHNSTSLSVNLGIRHNRPRNDHSEDGIYEMTLTGADKHRPLLTNARLAISVGNITQVFEDKMHGILMISQHLDASKLHAVVIEILTSPSLESDVLRIEGFWLSKGGEIVCCTTSETETEVDQVSRPSNEDTRRAQQFDKITGYHKKTVEIISSANIVSRYTNTHRLNRSEHHRSYDKLLEHSKHFEAAFSTLPIQPDVCLSYKCRIKQNKKARHITISDLYFRSGPVHSPLFQYPWSWASKPNSPLLLIFDIGMTDFHIFFTEQASNQGSNSKRQSLEAFTADFVSAYVNFILRIRRTTWHQQRPGQDTTYSYNSAPSDLIILIMMPVVPASFNPLLTATVHNALHTVVTTLQRVEGDKNTILIDTSGWLAESDFTHHSSQPHNPPPTGSERAMGTSNRAEEQPPDTTSLPTLNSSGHKKIAYFLSLHLCPYLAANPETCPFKRHETYTGNLYIPDEVAVGRVLEGKKIERIKALIGGF